MGMIVSAWGGTPVEGWSSRDSLRKCGLKWVHMHSNLPHPLVFNREKKSIQKIQVLLHAMLGIISGTTHSHMCKFPFAWFLQHSILHLQYEFICGTSVIRSCCMSITDRYAWFHACIWAVPDMTPWPLLDVACTHVVSLANLWWVTVRNTFTCVQSTKSTAKVIRNWQTRRTLPTTYVT